MRLTNVAQMELAAGRVFSYAVDVAPQPGRALPISFDQGRHVGEGQRPGSWMAFAFRLVAPASLRDAGAAWDAVVARHGTLRSVFSHDERGTLRLHGVTCGPGMWREHPVAPGQPTRDVLRAALDAGCAPFSSPSHRLCVVEPPPEADDRRPEVVIAADHAHVDMWSLVILARDFVACLNDLRAARQPGAGLPDAPPFSEHTAELKAIGPAPDDVVQRWAQIIEQGGGGLPVFPLPLGQLDPRPAEVVEVRDVLDAEGTERLSAIAQTAGVRLLALGVSVLTEVTQRLSGQPLRAVFPVHSRSEPRWREAVGWFITNAVLESSDPSPSACAGAVRESIELGSWPLGPIFEPHGRVPSPPGLFAVSWLDVRRLPVPVAHASQLRYVSAAIRTDGVMIWFLVNDSGLHLRCRYPDTPQAREHVGRWLDAVEEGIRALGGHPAAA
ncbi:MAG: hypothetical protein QM679_04680 [Patulibacter sp.]